MSLLVVYFIIATFAVPQLEIEESLEECSIYAEVYMNDIEQDYLNSLEDLYGDGQADRLTPETRKGCDSQNSMETLREISEEGTPPINDK